MLEFKQKEKYNVYDLKEIIALLRSPGGCPWDGEQTHESIRRNFLEEAYEACEAIDEKNPNHLCEELGDVLMQVIFHADIEEKAGNFNLDDVADMTCKKLIYRHPHIFSNVSADTSEKVLKNWEELKMKERGQRSVADTMKSVSHALPAMWRADKIISKGANAGFQWNSVSDALDKLSEEVEELRQAVSSGENISEELGDTIFSAVHVAQMLKIDPEEALSCASDKFISRFGYVEEAAKKDGKVLGDLTEKEMLDYYKKSKS